MIDMRRIISICIFVVCLSSILTIARARELPKGSGSFTQSIPEIMAQVSADSIRTYIQTLQNFFTRHTNSDTLSDTQGIGAARRWVFSKFQQFSVESGGRLSPEFLEFTATILGSTRLHKNVMATLPGITTPDRIFVVSGHLDSRNANNNDFSVFAPGASDDASGTVISIELARVMSNYEFQSTLVFMAVVGEDQGLFGSEAYATWARKNNLNVEGMITNDVVGNIVGGNGVIDSMSVRHFSSDSESTSHRQMSRYSKIVGDTFFPEFTVNLIPARDRPGRGGDHFSFQDAGYTAIRFTEPNENLDNQHSFTDLLENMSPAYTARVGQLNAAILASLADAPDIPEGLEVVIPGSGTELIARWTLTNTEPDLAGYRVAVREQDSIFYQNIFDVGDTTELSLSGLMPGVSLHLSLSAYDTAGNESIFSTEIPVTPQPVPDAVEGVTSTSGSNTILVRWEASPELDVLRYRIYRSLSRSSGFEKIDSVSVPATSYTDVDVQPQIMYFYKIIAVDGENNESDFSQVTRGRLSTHDQGILLIDGSMDGFGLPLSASDAQIDDFYAAILDGFALRSHWDTPDSDRVNVRITDADMGIYSTVVRHSDVLRNNVPFIRDSTEFIEFLESGGNLIISGWKLSTSFIGMELLVTQFPAGSFVPTYLKIDSIRSTALTDEDFISVAPVPSLYTGAMVDSARIPNFGGTLVNMDVFATPLRDEPTTQVLYTYESPSGDASPFHGEPIALKFYGPTYKLIVFDFPLYYMKQEQAQRIIELALLQMGEVVSTEDGKSSVQMIPTEYTLRQNYPNPFNPSTRIEYALPSPSNVTLNIYDLLGREVRTLFAGDQPPGMHAVEWNARDNSGTAVASGMYFYRLIATPAGNRQDAYVRVRKMVLIR